MTIAVLALAASNVSTALAVPIHSSREVREQSLSRRDPTFGTTPPPTGPGGSPGTDNPPTEPVKVKDPEAVLSKVPKPKGTNPKQLALNFLVGTAATMAGVSILKEITGAFSKNNAASSSSTSSANQNPSTYPSTPQNGYGQYQNQQRAVDHGKRADIFETKARSTSHLDLLSRGDLEEALKLFRRVLDELD